MKNTALIILDVDFSQESTSGANVLAVLDLAKDEEHIGDPFLSQETLRACAAGTANHGSTILETLRRLCPKAPFVLVRMADDGGAILRTQWRDGKISRSGWTEGYLRAVDICRQRGYCSIANASFGGFTHMEGLGWEEFQLSHVTGAGKPGHIFVAAAGGGNGLAEHGSWVLGDEAPVHVDLQQTAYTQFNLWAKGGSGWKIEVWRGGQLNQVIDGLQVQPNLWNGHQQVNFSVGADGQRTSFKVVRTTNGGERICFDCWVGAGDARFLDCINGELVPEPAVFPGVIAVGLRDKYYSAWQKELSGKPDVLLRGKGPVSFRVPEVVAAAAAIIDCSPQSDVRAVLAELHRQFGGKVAG